MKREDVESLVAQYAKAEGIRSSMAIWENYQPGTQYDDDSAEINYSFVRHFQPSIVVEFGSRTGRCTHDLMLALIRNQRPFMLKSYELEDDLREVSQKVIDLYFGENLLTIGGDVTKADDIPDEIDYVFVDNYHDFETTKWVFEVLLPKCRPGALIQFHDLRLFGDWQFDPGGFPPEVEYVVSQADKNGGPLEKLYWSWENGRRWESAWFIYNPK